MKKSFLILLLLALPVSSLLAQDKLSGIAADIPILMHRSLYTQGAFPLPWKRSTVMYEPIDHKVQWSFGWGKNIETELEWNRYLYKHIYSYSLRWKVPFDCPLQNGLFTEVYYSSYTNGKHLNINLGYVYNINRNLSIIPRLKVQGSSSIASGISVTWVPLKFISGNLGAENIFDNKSGTNINAQMSLKIRFWKGIFVEEKFIGGCESNEYYSEYLQQTLRDTKIFIRQEQYLGLMF